MSFAANVLMCRWAETVITALNIYFAGIQFNIEWYKRRHAVKHPKIFGTEKYMCSTFQTRNEGNFIIKPENLAKRFVDLQTLWQ